MASSGHQTKFEGSSGLELNLMVWLNDTLNQTDTEALQRIQEEVRSIINCQKTFEDLDECRQFIEKTKDSSLIIASNERLGKQLIPLVDHWRHIRGLYIYRVDDRSAEEQSAVLLNVSECDKSTDIRKYA